ncbi:hypothetical protein [Streptomyces virginiae]|uniref:hypothetical protein n=1 Tax=Streptomyces virginiae TaxID=1961 RepID=UPI0036DFBD0C
MSILIVPDVMSPEKLDPRRFAGKRTTVAPFTPVLPPFGASRPEVTLPGLPAVRRVAALSAAAAPTAVMIRSSIPLGGTESKILCRLPEALEVLATARPLSTGVLRKGAEMIYISHIRVGP